jgi:FkbM family methyltransferase
LQAVPFETQFGTVYGDLRNPAYRGLLTYSERETAESVVMRKFVRPGDTALDVGVYWGLYTVFMSRLVGENGTVHSFEPNEKLVPSLALTAQSLPNVRLHNIALSDRNGEVSFFVPKHDASMASLTDWTRGRAGDVEELKCKMMRLDDLVNEQTVSVPDFIKCDVEGAELAVFKGAVETLNRPDAPIIFFEVNPEATTATGNEPDTCFKFLESLSSARYRFFQMKELELEAINGFKDLRFNQFGFTNAVAVPRNRL